MQEYKNTEYKKQNTRNRRENISGRRYNTSAQYSRKIQKMVTPIIKYSRITGNNEKTQPENNRYRRVSILKGPANIFKKIIEEKFS